MQKGTNISQPDALFIRSPLFVSTFSELVYIDLLISKALKSLNLTNLFSSEL